jgi:hypothetical protein
MSIKALFAAIIMVLAVCSVASAQTTASTSDPLSTVVGKWTGTYDGASSGNFELVLNKDSNNKLGGQVVMIAPDGNRYPVDLKTATWEDNKLKASYTDPSGGGDVNIIGSFTDPNLKGTWDANGGQATGTWQVARATK